MCLWLLFFWRYLPQAFAPLMVLVFRVADLKISGTLNRLADVYSSKITNLDPSTMWTVGCRTTIEHYTWKLDDIPKTITNPNGKVVLGTIKEGNSDEHLELNGFDIRQGKNHPRSPETSVP